MSYVAEAVLKPKRRDHLFHDKSRVVTFIRGQNDRIGEGQKSSLQGEESHRSKIG